MMSPEVQEICNKIAQFYLDKNQGNHQKAVEEVEKLGITKIAFGFNEKGSRVEITTRRPGVIIGKRGMNLSELSFAIDCHIHIIEDNECPLDWMIGYIVSMEDPTMNKEYESKMMKEASELIEKVWAEEEPIPNEGEVWETDEEYDRL